MTPPGKAAARSDTAGLVQAVATLADVAGRRDLGDRLRAAAARAGRPTTFICVVGEFKQGKSSLVNALLGTALCPVDDDLATSALTLVHHGDALSVTVRRADGGKVTSESVDPVDLGSWVTEAGNPENQRQVERVDIRSPSPFLAEGVAIVDTPGAGGASTYAAATLAFLPFADATVFVTDASAELSAPEVEFLAAARDRCPVVIVALSKVDLYPEWRRIEEIDRGHLEAAGIEAEIAALSAPLRATALRLGDATLDTRSGYPALLDLLTTRVIRPARDNADARAASEATAVLDLLESSYREELAILADPSRLADVTTRLESARVRLDHLRGPGSRWSTLVNDRITDLSNDATYRLRAAMRDVLRETDEQIETLKTPDDWAKLSPQLQERVAGAVAEEFASLESGALSIRDAVTQLLEEEALALPPLTSSGSPDVLSLWRHQPLRIEGSRLGRAAGTVVTGLRGASGGLVVFGMLGRFAPAGLAALMYSNPVTLGLGVAFAGMQLLDANRRRLAGLRQNARTQVRQFLDDVQFEVGNRIGASLREIQRQLRDDLTAAIDALARSYAALAAQAQEAASADHAATARRSADIDAQLRSIAQAKTLLGTAGRVAP